jgi:predicted ATPase/DNA-binding SARP family transcriptional activator
MLAYLVEARHRAVPREELAESLWGEDLPASWDATLRGLAAKLRGALGRDAVTSAAGCYRLRLPDNIVIDIEEANALLADAEAALEVDPGAALSGASEAAKLLARPFLPEAGRWWVERRQRELHDQRVRALELTAEAALACDDTNAAVAAAEEALVLEPVRESAYQWLMEAYEVAGNRAQALQTYERCRRTLAEELGVGPSPKTEATYLRLPGVPTALPDDRRTQPAAYTHNLPVELTTFVGRDKERGDVDRLLDSSRLVTLVGPGGVGKTRLSLRVAAQRLDRHPDGVWLIELAGGTAAEHVAAAVASALGLRDEPGRPPTQVVVDQLHTRRLLIVLDNCEHLAEACAELVASVLRGSTAVHVLATSRIPLRVGGEAVYRVDPLPVVGLEAMPRDDLAEADAVRLFCERAMDNKPGFDLTERNAGAVARICSRLDGIPLAIELAAARLRHFTPTEVASRLDDRFALLTGGARGATARQETLVAAIDWSYDLLSDDQRTFFARLGVFSGGCWLDAVDGVCGVGVTTPVVTLLGELVDRSLVVADTVGERTRYRMLETIRAYASTISASGPEAEPVRTRHLRWFLGVLEEGARHIGRPDEAEWLNTVEADQDNVRSALAWALDSRLPDLALRLASAMVPFWDVWGHHIEATSVLEQALAQASDATSRDRGHAQLALAGLLLDTNYAAALPHLEAALDLLQAGGDTVGTAKALSDRAVIAREDGRYDNAQVDLERGIALFRAAGDEPGLAEALERLAVVFDKQGEWETGQALLDEAVALQRRQGRTRALGWSLADIGLHAINQGRSDDALAALDEALSIHRTLGYRRGVAWVLCALGELALDLGEFATARQRLHEAQALHRQMDEPYDAVWSLAGLGEVALTEGDTVSARAWFTDAWMTQERSSPTLGEVGWALQHLGCVAIAEGRHEHGAVILGACDALRTAIGFEPPPSKRPQVDAALEACRRHLGPGRFQQATVAGALMDHREAIQRALEPPPRLT